MCATFAHNWRQTHLEVYGVLRRNPDELLRRHVFIIKGRNSSSSRNIEFLPANGRRRPRLVDKGMATGMQAVHSTSITFEREEQLNGENYANLLDQFGDNWNNHHFLPRKNFLPPRDNTESQRRKFMNCSRIALSSAIASKFRPQ